MKKSVMKTKKISTPKPIKLSVKSTPINKGQTMKLAKSKSFKMLSKDPSAFKLKEKHSSDFKVAGKSNTDYKIIGGDMNGPQAFDGFSLSKTWNKLWSSATDSLSDAGRKLIDQNKQALLDKAQTLLNKELQQNPEEAQKAKEELAQFTTDAFREFVSKNKWYFIGGGFALLSGIGAIVYFSRRK